MSTFVRILTPVLLICGAATAHAAAGGHHDEGIPWLTLLFSTINLVLFVLLLRRFAMPSVRAWVQDRHDRILRDLTVADEARAAATRLKAEWEQRLADLEGQVATMHENARQDAERERDRILAEAQKTAQRIMRDAEQSAAAEIRQLRVALRAELAIHAVKLAEESARQQWTSDDQQRFVTDFLQQVSQPQVNR